jgi:hypothetical protein
MTPVRRSGARAASPADEVLSAMVILRAASGRRLAGSAAIDTTSLAKHHAAAGDVVAAQRACKDLGFTVGPHVGISFAISAPRSTFEEQFGVKLMRGAGGAIEVARNGKPVGLELPLDQLAATLRKLIDVVSFMPPVELHESETMV